MIPEWGADAGADAGQNGLAEGASGRVDGKQRIGERGFEHAGGVVGEGVPVWRESSGRDTEEGGHSLGFGVVLLALSRGERGEDEIVGVDGGEQEGGVDPEKGGDLVGLVVCAEGVPANGGGKLARDGRVAAEELARGGEGLGAGAEEHGVNDAEGGVEAANGVVKEMGVVREGGGDPGMGELEEGGAAGAEKDGGFAVDLPSDGVGAEKAEAGVAGKLGEFGEEVFACVASDVSGGFGRAHGLRVACRGRERRTHRRGGCGCLLELVAATSGGGMHLSRKCKVARRIVSAGGVS